MEDLFTPAENLKKVLDKEFGTEGSPERMEGSKSLPKDDPSECQEPGLVQRIRTAISNIFLVVVVFALVANPLSVGRLVQMFGVGEEGEEKKLGIKGFSIQTLIFAGLVTFVKFASYYDFI